MITELVLFSILGFLVGVFSQLLVKYLSNKFHYISKLGLFTNKYLNNLTIFIIFLLLIIVYTIVMASCYIFFRNSYVLKEAYQIWHICFLAGFSVCLIVSKYYQDKKRIKVNE
ncbi:hypothetical protein C8N29_1369 [Agitococcus lubricus]|uniref:Uncharacterized protein n=1 Tax=Agitococcus lubricus TaxID=1077255 RepID=A0A2T5ISA3_9GAMM|nr:hypothetical protein C8N29_1369 [Agitococcus lubricus]